jgi:hypothetical protein
MKTKPRIYGVIAFLIMLLLQGGICALIYGLTMGELVALLPWTIPSSIGGWLFQILILFISWAVAINVYEEYE